MRRSVTTALLTILLALGGAEGQTYTRGSASGTTSVKTSGSGSARGRASVTTSTSTTVTTSGRDGKRKTTTTTTSSGSDSTKGKEIRRGEGRRSSKEEVEVEDDVVRSTSKVSGTGSVSASSSASSGPKGSRGSASTTTGGRTKTVTKTKRRGGVTRTKKRTTKRGASKREGTGISRATTLGITGPIRTCLGLAKFRCCDDGDFVKINGVTYCGCWGSDPDPELCSFQRMSSNPLIVQDVFGGYRGETCQCAEENKTRVQPCAGRVKKECCDEYKGGKTCRCNDGKCTYERHSTRPLVWAHNSSPRLNCRCA